MKTKFHLSRYSVGAFRICCHCTALLAGLTCFSGIMIQIGEAPLQYYILTRQLLRQIPVLFLCGLLAVLICDIVAKQHMER